MKSFRQIIKGIVDQAVNLASGSTPHATLDGPRAYRVIAVLAVVTVAGGLWLLLHQISLATRPARVVTVTNTAALAQLDKLRSLDTDGDGLSDYDELYVYHTSPYLKDSDGDGVSDADEIKANTDPNCPKGKDCTTLSILASPVDAQGNLTPAFLRQALHAAGVPQAQLDQTSDDALIKIYQDVVAAENGSTNGSSTNATNAAGNSNTNSTALNDFSNLSAAEIRQLLVQNGVDHTTLDKIDDATLKGIFTQATNTNS